MTLGNMPILVGAADVVQRWDGDGEADDPLSLMAAAAAAAIGDTGSRRLAATIDCVAVVNTITWSYADAPRELARRLGIQANRLIYTTVGGNSPQYLVNRAAEALQNGSTRAVLLAGGEAGGALARARKLGRRFEHWPPRAEPESVEDDWRLGVSKAEQHYDLFLPSSMYPLIETAIRADARRAPDRHGEFLGALFARFAAVAAENPSAWFKEAYSAERIATPTPDNRYVGYPYTKLMNAIMQVDQAAALVMTTEATATELGIDRERWVHPMGGADANDVWHVTERPELHRSPAIRTAAARAFIQAGIRAIDVTAFDLYSCFPAAVELALEALEVEPTDPRALTITGGLPYFGGPGNNYSMHAIATAVHRIRVDREAKVLVSALGWYATKHSIGIYGGSRPAKAWATSDGRSDQMRIDASTLAAPLDNAEGRARVEAFVIRHGRDGRAVDGTALVRMDDGSRALAAIEASSDELESMECEELVGKLGGVRHDTGADLNRLRLR